MFPTFANLFSGNENSCTAVVHAFGTLPLNDQYFLSWPSTKASQKILIHRSATPLLSFWGERYILRQGNTSQCYPQFMLPDFLLERLFGSEVLAMAGVTSA
jgi:hypothetical protein